MEEKTYVPAFETLGVGSPRMGAPHIPDEVVGIAVERNKEGYATKAFLSDGKSYEFPRDLSEFLGVKDPRVFFVVGRDLEPILKYLGAEVCSQMLIGYGVISEGVQMTYHGSFYTRLPGGKTLRKIYTLKPFFWPGSLPDDMDCYSVQMFGSRIVQLLTSLDIPLRLNSAGSLLGEVYSRRPPVDVSELAYNSYHGGWIEAFKLGHFGEAYDYDISGAYPSEAARLVDLSGTWVHTKDWVQGAEYGFCYARIYVDIELPFSPLMFRRRSEMQGNSPYRAVLNPIGFWDGWITKDEIEFLVTNGLGKVEVADGYWYVPRDYYYQPFKEALKMLNRLKQEEKALGNVVASTLVKLMAASLQGRFMQSNLVWGNWRAGPAFNPVYAATITARVRCRVAKLALQSSDNILGVLQDGLLTDGPLEIPKGWRLEYQGECVIANHGDYWIEGRSTKRDLLKDLTEHKWRSFYPLRGERYCSIAEALKVGNFEVACVEVPMAKQQVKGLSKRMWKHYPVCCNDLLTDVYESTPSFPGGGIVID